MVSGTLAPLYSFQVKVDENGFTRRTTWKREMQYFQCITTTLHQAMIEKERDSCI